MSEIWRSDNWKNPNILYAFNRTIIEYDMRRAGLSLIKEYELLPPEKIQKLEALGKHDCDVQIGLKQKENKGFAQALSTAFANARHEFFHRNDLETDTIVAIKKDAIFTTKECKVTTIGDHIEFRPKNQYSSFCKVGKKNNIELYYGNNHIDVKGIGDDVLKGHEEGMMKFFLEFFRKMEMEPADRVLRFLRNTIDSYKNLNLPVDYYREFNARSSFVTLNGATFGEYWNEQKDELDITYNYFILCNLCKILL